MVVSCCVGSQPHDCDECDDSDLNEHYAKNPVGRWSDCHQVESGSMTMLEWHHLDVFNHVQPDKEAIGQLQRVTWNDIGASHARHDISTLNRCQPRRITTSWFLLSGKLLYFAGIFWVGNMEAYGNYKPGESSEIKNLQWLVSFRIRADDWTKHKLGSNLPAMSPRSVRILESLCMDPFVELYFRRKIVALLHSFPLSIHWMSSFLFNFSFSV